MPVPVFIIFYPSAIEVLGNRSIKCKRLLHLLRSRYSSHFVNSDAKLDQGNVGSLTLEQTIPDIFHWGTQLWD